VLDYKFIHRGAEKSLVLALQEKKSWWQLACPCCWNRARPWHTSELVSFLVGLRTYQHPGISTNHWKNNWDASTENSAPSFRWQPPCCVRTQQLVTKPIHRHRNIHCKNELCSHTDTQNSSGHRIAWIHVTRFGTRKTKAAQCSIHKPLNLPYLHTCVLTYFVTYLLAYLLTYFLAYLLPCLLTYYLLAYFLIYLLACLFTYLLTYSFHTAQYFWEANRTASSQEIPAFYGNRKFITASTTARYISISL